MLEDNYEGMKEYIRYMQTWVDEDGIMFSQRVGKDGKVLKWFNLGEWVAPGETVPDDMVHTFYFWRCADLTAQTADILNLPEEAAHYRTLASQTKTAFMEKFYDEENSTYGKGGGNIFALKMGVPEEQYEGVINSLKMDIEANDRHIDTGIFGTQFFFEILAENGMQDLAYEVMNQRTEPSYGHWLELGSTTTREQWSTAGSHNHPMFGGGLVWFYRKLAGMQADPENPGYRHIIFQPQPVDELKFVKYSNNTSYGLAGISWRNEDKKITMKVTVPVGSEATVYVPALDEQKVYESGREVSKMSEIQFIEKQENFVLYKIGSGIYEFEVAR
jgi:alpha-L-rhamnosidase